MATLELTITLPALHAPQQVIQDHPARFKILACGRKFGKTELGKDTLIDSALGGLPYAYFTQTYKQVREMWDRILEAARPVITSVNKQQGRIEFIGGGLIDFWSLQAADTVRGFAYAGVVVDEAAQIADLGKAWNNAIRPTLTEYRGWALFLSTPQGRDYFFTLYQRGQDSVRYPAWESWHHQTSDNPFIDPDEIEEARGEMPSRAFSQEYLAEFLSDGGAVFRNIEACTIEAYQDGPIEDHVYVFGVDWGKSNDFTAIAVIDCTTMEIVWIEYFNEIGWSLQRGRLVAMYEHWKPDSIYAEENSIGDPNIEALQAEGLPVFPFMTTAQSKTPLIESLALALEKSEIGIINDPVLLNELQAYTMKRLPSGRFAYSAPSGMHDDTVIASALALYGAHSGGGFTWFET